MTLANRCGERALKGNSVFTDRLNGVGGDGSLSVDEDGGDIDLFPLDRRLHMSALLPILLSREVSAIKQSKSQRMNSPTVALRPARCWERKAYLGGFEDGLDRVGNLGTDTITGDQSDSVITLRCISSCPSNQLVPLTLEPFFPAKAEVGGELWNAELA